MKSMIQTFELAKREIDGADHVLLLTDERSDGDTFGSSLAFAEHLRDLGKKVTHVAGYTIPASLRFLPGIELVIEDRSIINDETIDLAIVFDSSREKHVSSLLAHLTKPVTLVMFDHHKSNALFADVNAVYPALSSTCEIVYEYFLHHTISVSRSMATCLMTGILTDTGVLTNPVTNSDAVARAGELLTRGGSIAAVVKNIMKQVDVGQLKLWGRIFDRAIHVQRHNMAVFWVADQDYKQTGTTSEQNAELMDYLASTLNVELVLLMKDRGDGTVKVSMRSRSKDVSKIAKHFGGGGHAGACGFSVEGRLRVGKEGGSVVSLTA